MVADFDTAYSQPPTAVPPKAYYQPKPGSEQFPASHVAPQTEFLQNTYLMRPDRNYIPAAAVPIRAGNLCRNK